MGTSLFYHACSEKTRGNGLKMRRGRFRLDIGRKMFPCYGGQALEQVAQRGGGVTISGGVPEASGSGAGCCGLGVTVMGDSLIL